MNTTTLATDRQRMLLKWSDKLAAALERRTGAKASIRQDEYNRKVAAGQSLWWTHGDETGSAGKTVWIGVARGAWDAVAGRLAGPDDPASRRDESETLYSSVLNESWDAPGRIAAGTPPREPQLSFRIAFSETEFVDLLLVFESDAAAETGVSDDYSSSALGVLMDIELPVTLRFGRTQMKLEEILGFRSGSIAEFDRRVDEPIDVLVNGHLVARGEAVTVHGNCAVRILEIADRDGRIESTSFFVGED